MMLMDIRLATMTIWDDKAFVTSEGRYRNGIFTNIEPVYVVSPMLKELVPVIQAILSTEPTLLPDPTKQEIKARQDLLPRVTGAGSWKRLGQRGISYVIELSPKGIVLEMSRLDANGRWEFDPNKQTKFALDTDLSVIIQAALDDLNTRP
jgi:hypothetical protein